MNHDDICCVLISGVVCMTRYTDLIRGGGLKAHGIYYFVPGLLRHFDTEAVMALTRPGVLSCRPETVWAAARPLGIREAK